MGFEAEGEEAGEEEGEQEGTAHGGGGEMQHVHTLDTVNQL